MESEKIASAAVYHGVVISLPPPARHHTILQAMNLESGITGAIMPECQGFLTSYGRYVGRVEAYYIASAAGQIRSSRGPDAAPRLFSEDLW